MNRMMKNAVCLVLLFALTVFCCAGAAESTVVASGSCGTGVTWALDDAGTLTIGGSGAMRSEERRVGKECRSRWSPYH